MVKEIFIKNRKGLKMAVRLNIDSDRDKLVFLEHGLGARKEYPHMLVLEEFFAKYGYNVVNLDATNSLNASDSSAEGITFTGHYQDLEDVIEWAKTQNFYKEPFALAGQSLGAEAVMFYAGKNPSKVELVISAALPWIDGNIEVKVNKRTEDILKQGFYDQISRSTGRVLRIYKNYLDDVSKYNLTDVIKNVTARIYLLVGGGDSEYHIQNSKRVYEMLNCPKRLFLLENVPHDLANTPETKATFEETLTEIFEQL